MTGCSELGLSGVVGTTPTTQQADAASGLNFDLDIDDQGLLAPEGTAQSDIRRAVVVLPAGMTLNPSAADGLAACSEGEFAAETLTSLPGGGCPGDSKIGNVEVETPLLKGELLRGSLYVAAQDANLAHSRFAVYLVIRDQQLGILVKLPGRLDVNPLSGQLVTTFGDPPYELPQFPFSHLRFHFREGPRGPLVTPPACGRYGTEAYFEPWSGTAPLSAPSTFEIVSGVAGAPCPAGVAPFNPAFEAGSVDNVAATFSPFGLRLSRQDGEQEITRLSSILPPGVLAKIAGVGKCSESDIAAARSKTGREELAAPSCPSSAQIGRVTAGAGVGSALTYISGRVYLAGPVGGDPLSVVVITPAVAGPFDLGTVVVREALTLDPSTAEVRLDGAASDPIPHILEGIPLKLRNLRVYVDRPGFTLNPTSCDPLATRGTAFGGSFDLFSSADDVTADLSARYQAANCRALGFQPKLAIRLKGGTDRGAYPALRATVRAPLGAEANISRAVVTLPHSVFLAQEHIGTICTRVQFAAAKCPKGSIYGRARAFTPLIDGPLEGPVYLRSSNHPLPDLVAALHGIVDIEVSGRIDSKGGRLRTTFEGVPDAPVSKFVLGMRGGKKGLVVNSRDLCSSSSRASATLTGHNGKIRKARPVVKPSCHKSRKHKR
jgi:hypothetical protein